MVFERLRRMGDSKQDKLNRMREELERKEMESCTFKPKIRGSARKRNKSKSKARKKSFTPGERLYKEAQEREKRKEEKRQLREEKFQKEIRDNLKKGRKSRKSKEAVATLF